MEEKDNSGTMNTFYMCPKLNQNPQQQEFFGRFDNSTKKMLPKTVQDINDIIFDFTKSKKLNIVRE